VDEYGFQRLKKTLFQIKLDFEMSIVPKLLQSEASGSSKQAAGVVAKLRDDMKIEIAREYEKTIYIL
jgi:hypothetical protein